MYLGTVTRLRVTAVDAHTPRVHACLASTRGGLRWAFMGGTLLQPSLPGQYRGNVAERQRSPSWGGFAAPGARLEPPRVPTVFVHDLSPKLWCYRQPQGWPVDAAGWPGTCSGSCPGSAPPATWGHLGGTSPLQRSPCCPGRGCPPVMGCAATGLSPWGEALQPLPLHPLTFPCLGPSCSRNDPYLSPVCAVCPPVSCLLNVPVQVPSEFPVTPVSPVRLCHPVSHVPAVRSPLLEPRTFQCPFCAFCVS